MDQANLGIAPEPQEEEEPYQSPTPEQEFHASSDAGSIAPSSIAPSSIALSSIATSLASFRPSVPRLNVQEIAPVSRIDETLDAKLKN
jgi:hypothetical protein